MMGRDDNGEAGANSENYVDFPTCSGSRTIDSFFTCYLHPTVNNSV